MRPSYPVAIAHMSARRTSLGSTLSEIGAHEMARAQDIFTRLVSARKVKLVPDWLRAGQPQSLGNEAIFEG
jgi:hypothetical protein